MHGTVGLSFRSKKETCCEQAPLQCFGESTMDGGIPCKFLTKTTQR